MYDIRKLKGVILTIVVGLVIVGMWFLWLHLVNYEIMRLFASPLFWLCSLAGIAVLSFVIADNIQIGGK